MTTKSKMAITELSKLFGTNKAIKLMDDTVVFLNAIQGKGFSWDVSKEVAAIVPLLPETGAIVFDVGANKGEWSDHLLRKKKQIHKIYAFEPSKWNRKYFGECDSSIVELIQVAVGKEEGEAVLYSDAIESGLASLHQRQLDFIDIKHEPQETVKVLTLDSFAEERNIEVIHFLKMDIEGHEFQALEGAKDLLIKRRIHALSFEFGGANIDSRTFFKDFWYLLSGYGFKIYRIMPNAKLYRIPKYSEDLENFRTTNYVAVLSP